jgi:HSP20 family protein
MRVNGRLAEQTIYVVGSLLPVQQEKEPAMQRPPTLPSLFDRDRDPFTALRKQFDDIFDAWTGGSGAQLPASAATTFAPRVDVSETDKEVKVCADLPGLEEKDVEVKLAGNQLTIRGEKKAEHEEKEGDEKEGRFFHRIERSYGAFQRSIAVPFDVDPDKVEATFKNGVLTVTVAKPDAAQKAARKIEVKKAT